MALALSVPAGGPATLACRPERPAIRRLTVTDFRSYGFARLATDGRSVVLTGPNGAGKTNLLEAVSLLAPGRGLRGARLSEIDRIGGGPFGVAARAAVAEGEVELATGRAPEPGRERRIVRIEGETVPGPTALAEHLGILWLTPWMDRLFQEGPGERRRFLDRLVTIGDPGHASTSARYQHALRERARLLRDGCHDPAWLHALEARAAASGVAMAAARRHAVQGLMQALAIDPGPFLRPHLALAGDVEGWLATSAALEVEERFASALAGCRAQDADSGTTALGPHRSDLLVSDQASGCPAALASTGQQKALLISIVLAEARRRAREGGRLPLLLLDEVAAHLDPARREQLFEEIQKLGAQAWLTGTDPEAFRPLAGAACFVDVSGSILSPHD